MKRSGSWILLLAFVVGLARTLPFLLNPTLVAEEGQVFLSSYLSSGKIEWMNAGYLNAFTTISLWAAYKIVPSFLPWLGLILAGIIRTIAWSFLLRAGWEQFFSRSWRLAFAFAFIAFSPCLEGHYVLLYSFWYLGVGALLLLTEAYAFERRLGVFEILWIVCALLSGPVAVQLFLGWLLAVGLQSVWNKEFPTSFLKREWLSAIAILAAFLLQMKFLLHGNGDPRLAPTLHNAFDVGRAFFHQLNMRIILPFFASEGELEILNAHRWAGYLSLPVTVLFLIWTCRQLRKSQTPKAMACIASSWLVFSALTFYGRPVLVEGFKSHPYGVMLVGSRYSMIQQLLFAILVGHAMSLTVLGRKTRVLVVVGMLLFAQARVIDFVALPFKTVVPWATALTKIEEFKNGLGPDEVDIPTVPDGWRMHLKR